VRGAGQQRLPGAGPGIAGVGGARLFEVQRRGIDRHPLQGLVHGAPAAHVLKPQVHHGRKPEHDHEELKHFGVDRRGQTAFKDIHQHHARANPQRHVVIPAEQLVEQLGQRIHRDARRKHGHYREGNRVERPHPLIEAHFQIFRHGARLRAVIEGHHEDRQKHHCRDGSHPVEMAGGDAVLGPAGCHAHQFQRPEIGRNKRQPGHPRRNRTARGEEVRRAFQVFPEGKTDADDKSCISEQNKVIRPGELHMHSVYLNWGGI